MATTNSSRTARRSTRSAGSSRRKGAAGPGADAIALLKDDHRTVEGLFKSFENSGSGARKTRRKLVDQMITELSRHAAIEEEVLYPSARELMAPDDGQVLESLEEHHVVKWELSELAKTDPTDERFEAKVAVMIENVRHHVHEEEGELFPFLRAHLGRKHLVELGEALRSAKRYAPTRPHPRAPDEPPANLVPNAVSGALDRARDVVRSARAG